MARNTVAYDREYYQRKSPEKKLDARLKARYGINLFAYQQLLLAQGGMCGLCGELPTKGKRLAVDHDHATGAVRGLLHLECNTAIAMLDESPTRAERAADYLRKHGA